MIAPYLLRPTIILGLLAIVTGPASTPVNLRRAEFSAETMVHGIFPEIIVGMALGGRDAITPGEAVCAALAAAALTVASRKPRHSKTATVILLTAFFSLGIVISLRIRDMSGQLESLMFGRLLDITLSHMGVSAVVFVLAAALLALTRRAQIAVTFDCEAPRMSGIPVIWIDIAFNAVLGAIVVAASVTVGVLLVVGYLIVPGAFGRLLAAGPRSMVLLAGTCTFVNGWAGFDTSPLRTPRSLSPRTCMALGILVCFVGTCVLREIRARRVCPRPVARETARETSTTGKGKQQ